MEEKSQAVKEYRQAFDEFFKDKPEPKNEECQDCSPKTESRHGPFIRRDDQKWHICYIHVKAA